MAGTVRTRMGGTLIQEYALKAIPSFIILIRFNLIRINTLSLVKLFQKGNNRNSSISNKINRGALSNSYALNT